MTTDRIDLAEVRERVRAALPLFDVAMHDGLVPKKVGNERWSCVCPFHQEKSPSFVIGGKMRDRGHCFGCGWDGDIFGFWMERRGVDFPQAVRDLAGLAGIYVPDMEFARPVKRVTEVRRQEAGVTREEHKRPSLPPLRHLKADEVGQLAMLRGLDVEAVRWACFEEKRVAFSMWPLFQSRMMDEGGRMNDEWLPRQDGAFPSWLVTDHTRAVAEFRRLDGEKYLRADGTGIKAWSTCGKNWPLGAADLRGRTRVLVVEGGPDMLAAYHFLLRWRMLESVAVICMLGASNRMRDEALVAFAGCRVRIMADADGLKDDPCAAKRKLPGVEAAARWEEQLTTAGAAVETFNLGPIYNVEDFTKWARCDLDAASVRVDVPGFTMRDGAPVKDLNDLARCGPDVTEAADVREAFTCWDF